MLLGTAELVETFDAAPFPVEPAPIPLSRGAADPVLVCVPSFVVGTGPHQFGRLARELGAEHTVAALRLPGTRAGEPLPQSWDVLLEYLTAAVETMPAGRPVVLVGYSAGGAIAHALAHRLEQRGRGPAAVVLLDTYCPDDADQNRQVLVSAVTTLIDLGDEITEIGDHGLIAMAKYARLFDQRERAPISAPTFDLRAGTPLPGVRLDEPVPAWLHTGTTVTVDADHFSLIGAASATVAHEIRSWLGQHRAPEPGSEHPTANAHGDPR
ncbi:hypothetical protein C5B73_00745 [Nocardia cyriacigeorgica]|nr:hypothetical protein C5B73_00745 [Nocardia cyriacigeorgica]